MVDFSLAPLRCLVVDDDALARQVVANCIARTPFLQLAGSCGGAFEALLALRSQPIDLLLLDMAMPGLSGPDLLRALPSAPPTILIASTAAPVRNASGLQVVDYLPKPIAYARFRQAAELARAQVSGPGTGPEGLAPATAEYLWVRTTSAGLVRLRYADVCYAEALENAVRLHLLDGGLLRLPGSLPAVEGQLPAGQFARVHRAFLVRLAAVQVVEEQAVGLADGRRLPLGAAYRAALVARLPRL